MAADDNNDTRAAAGAAASGATLGAALSTLAGGMAGPSGKPLSAQELSEIRSAMMVGAYATAKGTQPPSEGGQAHAAAAPLSSAEIAVVRARMMVQPYVPHPMPADAAGTDRPNAKAKDDHL